jgi:hypothetical protein
MPTKMEQVLTDRLMQEDSALMTGMLQVFLQLAPERLDKLDAAAQRSDAFTLGQEARKIAAAAEQLAARELTLCVERVQLAANRGDFGQVHQDLMALRREIQSLEALSTT